MRLKRCKHCGKDFQTDKPGAYLCPECAAQAKKDSVVRDRTCVLCGATFPGGPRAKYCPPCRADMARKRDAERKRSGPRRPLGSTDHCAKCGKEYVVTAGLQRYCKDCAPAAMAENIRNHKKIYTENNKERSAARKNAMRSFNKVCVICGKTFDTGTPTVTCSAQCEKELKFRKQAAADFKRGRRKTSAPERYDSGLPKSGIPGITFSRKRQKWEAKLDGKYIGVFRTVEEAALAQEQRKNQA